MKVINRLSLIAALLFSSQAIAVEPTIKLINGPAHTDVYVDGEITAALPRTLIRELARTRVGKGTIHLNSIGGDVNSAIDLGTAIRKLGLNTSVSRLHNGHATAGSCQSACVLVFASGNYRYAEPRAHLGIHQFYSKTAGPNDLATGQVVSVAITTYLEKMGVSQELFKLMVIAGPIMQKLPIPKAIELGLVNNGLEPADWSLRAEGGRVLLAGQQRSNNGNDSIVFGCSRKTGITITAQHSSRLVNPRMAFDGRAQSLIVNGSYVSLGPDAVSTPTVVRDGTVSVTAKIQAHQASQLSRASSIGFAWVLVGKADQLAFEVPIGRHSQTFDSFLEHCVGL